MYSLGIDSGSTLTKACLYDGNEIVELLCVPTGNKPQETMEYVYNQLKREDCYVVTTGYGRNLLDTSDKKITEISCHAKGALYLHPSTRFVIDIGGQDCKVIKIDEYGNVCDFLMNDKCAAGTGRFIEMMIRVLKIEESLDDYVRDAHAIKMSSMCAVFAESEMISLLAKKYESKDIALGAIEAICDRTAKFSMKLNLFDDIYFSGGLSGYKVFANKLSEYTNRTVYTHELGSYTGAIGAAIIGYQKMKKERR
ncbi:MAG: hypothetical protein HUJ53_01460 [Holdemanella sp.]|nr:hypothetical protein [Holdemanella sp.]